MIKKIYDNILETVGDTPLVKLNRITKGIQATVLAKVEFFNPGGSVKDRIALAMIEAAENEGRLKPGGTIVEATSGNTGAGLALVAAIKGYKTVFTMPDKMSQEKVRMLKAYGAEVIICPTAVPHDSPESYHSVAEKMVRETPNSILANQYFNPQNPESHYRTTGPEIWDQTDGKIDCLVSGVGTGGTISGAARFLKEKNPKIRIVGADPVGSALREYYYTRKVIHGHPYKVEGIGQEIIPGTVWWDYIDEMHSVSDKESFLASRRLAREEGMLVGGSAGSAMFVALKVAKELPAGKVMVVILPDTGKYYLSKFYSDEWMKENRFVDIEKVSLERVLDVKSNGIPTVISVEPTATVREALEMMKKYNISQMPVLLNGKSVGSVEEGEVMTKVIENSELLKGAVKQVMNKSFPVVSSTETIENAKTHLTRHNPAVLIEKSGSIVGLITKSDLLDFIV
jgi:cystathionine beta-synthase